MKRSITHRIYRGFLFSGIVYTVCIYFIADLMDDDIERAMLSAGMAEQQAFYAEKIHDDDLSSALAAGVHP